MVEQEDNGKDPKTLDNPSVRTRQSSVFHTLAKGIDDLGQDLTKASAGHSGVGGSNVNFRTITADTTVLPEDDDIFCNTTSGPITVTMLPTLGNGGNDVSIKNIGTGGNLLTVQRDPATSDLVESAASVTFADAPDKETGHFGCDGAGNYWLK